MESKMDAVKNCMKKLAGTYVDAMDLGFGLEYTFWDRAFYPMIIAFWTLLAECSSSLESYVAPGSVMLKCSTNGVFLFFILAAMLHRDKKIKTLENFMFAWKIAFDLTVFSGLVSFIGNHLDIFPVEPIPWTVCDLAANMIPIMFLIGVIRSCLIFPFYALNYWTKTKV